MDAFGPALILLPVVSQLTDPFKGIPILDVVEVKVLHDVSSMDIDYD